MENITMQYLSRGTTWLCISTLIYFLMNGAQIFETVVILFQNGPHRRLNLSNYSRESMDSILNHFGLQCILFTR